MNKTHEEKLITENEIKTIEEFFSRAIETGNDYKELGALTKDYELHTLATDKEKTPAVE